MDTLKDVQNIIVMQQRHHIGLTEFYSLSSECEVNITWWTNMNERKKKIVVINLSTTHISF